MFVDIPYAAKLRGLPIGYDRWGNSFWLLAVQESMTIFPFDHSGRALDPADQSTTEPCILCRDMNGTWSYNNGCKLADLLDTFSEEYPCEMLLKAKLIERFHTVRSKLRVFTQQIKPTHQSWLEKKISLERWVAEMTLYGGPNESHRCRQLEVVWARCGESRINLLCGMIGNHSELNSDKFPLAFQSEILHRTKFSQPLSIEDSFDHHHTKGWNRADLFSKIRQIAASTTASCLLADGQSAQSLQASLAKSQFLQKNESTVPQNFNSESVTNKLVAQLHPITSEVIHLYSSVDSVCDCFGVSAVDVLKAVTSRPTGKLEGFLWQLRDDSDTGNNTAPILLFASTDLQCTRLLRLQS